MKKTLFFAIFQFILSTLILPQYLSLIDNLDSKSRWNEIASDGASIKITEEGSINNKYLRIDYEFLGAGYCGIEKTFPFTLPANYKFTFMLKGTSPKNNLEFKLIDKSGDNVWWKNHRNFDFPIGWEKITIKKRDIQFAWGPLGGGEVRQFEKIQIIIAAAEGGKGTIYLDDLTFEEISAPKDPNVKPTIYSSTSSDKKLLNVIDDDLSSVWKSKQTPYKHDLTIDFKFTKEIGGLVINWAEEDFARNFDVLISNDKKRWERIFTLSDNNLIRNFIHLKNIDAQYIKFNLYSSSRNKGFGIKEIEVKDYQFSQSLNDFFTNIARYYNEGSFPKYFYDKQAYWTVIGVSEDDKEALINELGTIEVDKTSFSLEPFINLNGKLITWNDVERKQSLEQDYLPIPSVKWIHPLFNLETKTFAAGNPNNSVLLVRYRLKNTSDKTLSGKFSLAVRPYQVNPKWQFLNNEGGIAPIKMISYTEKILKINDKTVFPLVQPDDFGASEFYKGEIIDYLLKNSIPDQKSVEDNFGFASCALNYNFNLQPNEIKDYIFEIPFYPASYKINETKYANSANHFENQLAGNISFWKDKLDRIKIKLPSESEKIVNSLKSNLAYILINKDGPAIQPGSRSYERSWMRDGALTSSALLRLGLKAEVRNYLDWFSQYQFPSGKIPCVVDKRGADPTPENDSHGEYIYAILQYFKFTHDTLFLKQKIDHVIGTVNYIEFLTNQRKTEQYKKPDSTVFFGLMPESISHEGYSAKPMHSYWDDFFTIRGLRDAVDIAIILKEKELIKRFESLRDEFETNLLNSIKQAIANHNIDYIPGCAELGDFDATSTTIALFPCNEQKNLPSKELLNTFEKYYQFCLQRMSPQSDWVNYTPYELRTVGSLILLNEKERAHNMLDFFFDDQRPKEWNHWAEVVWKNIDEPRFIGDMPHTWVGSDFINSIRTMFVYENDLDSTLILGAGLNEEWFDSPEGISIENMPTYYGEVSYTVNKINDTYRIEILGDVEIPKNKIRFKNLKNILPVEVWIDGKESKSFNNQDFIIEKLPSLIEAKY